MIFYDTYFPHDWTYERCREWLLARGVRGGTLISRKGSYPFSRSFVGNCSII